MSKQMILNYEYKPKQPELCKNCIWGCWDGMKQYCPKLTCIKKSL